MNYIKSLRFYLCLFAALALYSCNEETETISEPQVDISDPNEVTESVSIPVEGASVVTGNPPLPTGNAPQISNPDTSSVKINPGGEVYFGLSFNQAQSNIQGFYLQVNGADSYYDIPLPTDRNKSGNLRGASRLFRAKPNLNKNGDESGVLSIPLEIPANASLGTFCVSYCVYDSLGNVSNVVERCVEITSDQVGTDETGLLVSDTPWTLTRTVNTDNLGTSDETSWEERIGETYRDTVEYGDQCQAVIAYTRNSMSIKFRQDGRYILLEDYSEILEENPDSCSNYDRTEFGTFTRESFGYWSYNANTRIMTILEEREEEDNRDGREDDGNLFIIRIELLNQNELVAVNTDSSTFESTFYFVR